MAKQRPLASTRYFPQRYMFINLVNENNILAAWDEI